MTMLCEGLKQHSTIAFLPRTTVETMQLIAIT